MSLISVENLTVKYGQNTALSGVSMAIDKAEIVTVVGPNGSGKSSLIRSLIGAITPTSGSIETGPDLSIGYVPQKLHIDPTLPLTVARFMQLPHKDRQAPITQTLKMVGLMDIENRQMTSLSGGQFQRVLLARAILHKPSLLILDEPTQGLDQRGSAAFYQLIEHLRSSLGCAILMVSHELHVVMSASDRVICLNGHVCCHGTPDIVASAPEYRALFGTGTGGALALYRHDHNHSHDTCDHGPQKSSENV
ncbi:MAG: metal ABC transporter ATP-binding protein [Rhodobacterales bacterium]